MQTQIIYKVKSQYWKIIHKFGIEIQKNVDKAFYLDNKIKFNTGKWRLIRILERLMLLKNCIFIPPIARLIPEQSAGIGRNILWTIKRSLSIWFLTSKLMVTSLVKYILLLMVLRLNHPNHSPTLLLFPNILYIFHSFQPTWTILIYLFVTYP